MTADSNVALSQAEFDALKNLATRRTAIAIDWEHLAKLSYLGFTERRYMEWYITLSGLARLRRHP